MKVHQAIPSYIKMYQDYQGIWLIAIGYSGVSSDVVPGYTSQGISPVGVKEPPALALTIGAAVGPAVHCDASATKAVHCDATDDQQHAQSAQFPVTVRTTCMYPIIGYRNVHILVYLYPGKRGTVHNTQCEHCCAFSVHIIVLDVCCIVFVSYYVQIYNCTQIIVHIAHV